MAMQGLSTPTSAIFSLSSFFFFSPCLKTFSNLNVRWSCYCLCFSLNYIFLFLQPFLLSLINCLNSLYALFFFFFSALCRAPNSVSLPRDFLLLQNTLHHNALVDHFLLSIARLLLFFTFSLSLSPSRSQQQHLKRKQALAANILPVSSLAVFPVSS